MDHKEIENKLWLDFLNRLELEKNARPKTMIRFVFDKGIFEGVNITEFQRKALGRFVDAKAVKDFCPYYDVSTRAKLSLSLPQDKVESTSPDDLLPRPQPAGYDVEFGSDELFNSFVETLRASLKAGGVNVVPIFQFKVIKRDIVIHDFEQGRDWYVHKMNLDSSAHRVIEIMQTENMNDITRQYLAKNGVEVKNLSNLVGEIKFTGDLKKAFFDTGADRLILREVITMEDLAALKLTSAAIRKQLRLIERD